jgi:hypothetical protein
MNDIWIYSTRSAALGPIVDMVGYIKHDSAKSCVEDRCEDL